MSLHVGVLTVSDRVSTGQMEDRGGPAVAESVVNAGWYASKRETVADDEEQIRDVLQSWVEEERVDVIFTTGGTGLGPRDVTPQATAAVARYAIPGIGEMLRAAGRDHTPFAILSRGEAVVSGHTIIINLPGSPGGAAEGVDILAPILEHAVATLRGAKH